jgi:hypothetical protein
LAYVTHWWHIRFSWHHVNFYNLRNNINSGAEMPYFPTFQADIRSAHNPKNLKLHKKKLKITGLVPVDKL